MNALFGKHPGFRAAHAKGIVCEGEFTPAASAATLSKAPHLQGRPVKADGPLLGQHRHPRHPGRRARRRPARHGRPLPPPDGAITDIVTNAFNGFPVATGEDFLAFLRAVAASARTCAEADSGGEVPGVAPQGDEGRDGAQADPGQLRHRALFRNNAFSFTNRQGKSRFGRYQLRPESGSKFLAAEEAAKKPPNFLIDEIGERLATGPAKFRIVVQLAAEGDKVNDATEVWPDKRPTIELGVLSITGKVADNDAAQRTLAFDPLNLVNGIEASDDPLLETRSAVYAISRRRRRT